VPDRIRTAYAVMALCASGRNLGDPTVAAAVDWLVKNRENNGRGEGGWAYRPGCKLGSAIFPTALVLIALLAAKPLVGDLPHEVRTAVFAGVRCLRKRVVANSYFADERGIEHCKEAHTIYALRALMLAKQTVSTSSRRISLRNPNSGCANRVRGCYVFPANASFLRPTLIGRKALTITSPTTRPRSISGRSRPN
jgi:hypothetical protein